MRAQRGNFFKYHGFCVKSFKSHKKILSRVLARKSLKNPKKSYIRKKKKILKKILFLTYLKRHRFLFCEIQNFTRFILIFIMFCESSENISLKSDRDSMRDIEKYLILKTFLIFCRISFTSSNWEFRTWAVLRNDYLVFVS